MSKMLPTWNVTGQEDQLATVAAVAIDEACRRRLADHRLLLGARVLVGPLITRFVAMMTKFFRPRWKSPWRTRLHHFAIRK